MTNALQRLQAEASTARERLPSVLSGAASAATRGAFRPWREREAPEQTVEGDLQGGEGPLQRTRDNESLQCVLPGAAAASTAGPAQQGPRGGPWPAVGGAPRGGEGQVRGRWKSCSGARSSSRRSSARSGAPYGFCSTTHRRRPFEGQTSQDCCQRFSQRRANHRTTRTASTACAAPSGAACAARAACPDSCAACAASCAACAASCAACAACAARAARAACATRSTPCARSTILRAHRAQYRVHIAHRQQQHQH